MVAPGTLLLIGLLASAGSPESLALEPGAPAMATQRYVLGRVAYGQGQFAEALRELEVAYALFPTSVKLAYNLARTNERLEHWAEAARYYRRYLELAPAAPDHAEITAIISVMERRAEAQQPAPAPAPVSTDPAPVSAEPAPPPSAPPVVAAPVEAPPPASGPGLAPWLVVGGGVLLGGVAAGLYAYHESENGQGLSHDAHDRITVLMPVTLGLSVAAVGGGLAWWWFTRDAAME
jgi:tetratricopeptide (TPR) repeat protein